MTQEALKLALEALERFEGNKKLWPEAITAIKEALAQTQEPDDIASILACRDMLDAQPVQPRTEERNFCSRCGKLTKDLTVIHTCTPPQD